MSSNRSTILTFAAEAATAIMAHQSVTLLEGNPAHNIAVIERAKAAEAILDLALHTFTGRRGGSLSNPQCIALMERRECLRAGIRSLVARAASAEYA